MGRFKQVLADTFTLGVAQVLVLGLTALQTLVAAHHLGPQGFGVYALVTVAMTMASLGTPGFLGAAYRELPHLRSLNDQKGERRVFLHTALGEIGFSAVWGTGIAVFALLQSDEALRGLLLLAAVIVVPIKLYQICQLFGYVEKDFRMQAKADAARALVGATMVCSLIWILDLYAMLLALLFANLVGIWLYRRRYPPIFHAAESLNLAEFLRLGRIGLPISGLNVVAGTTGLQNWGERLMIGSIIGSSAVGIYAFFGWVVLTLLGLFASLMQVLRPHLYELMSQNFDATLRRRYLVLPTWLVSVAAMILLGGCAVVLPDLIGALLPAYESGVPVLYLLLVATVASCIFWVPVIVINSVAVNGQSYHFLCWCAAVFVSLVADYLMLAAGAGLSGVAAGYLLCQLIVLCSAFWRVRHVVFEGTRDAARFLASLMLPAGNVLVAVLVAAWLDFSFVSPLGFLWITVLKGFVFLALCLPIFVTMEKQTNILCLHVLPWLKRLQR